MFSFIWTVLKVTGILVGFFVIVALVSVAIEDSDSGTASTQPAELSRKETVEEAFSAWDGSHLELTKVIKDDMHDAGSYEHVETLYWDKGDYILVQTKFRGTNAFGAKVLDSVTAKCTVDGQVIELVQGD